MAKAAEAIRSAALRESIDVNLIMNALDPSTDKGAMALMMLGRLCWYAGVAVPAYEDKAQD